METSTLLIIVSIAIVLTVNSDFEKVYNKVSNFLFGGKSNICRY